MTAPLVPFDRRWTVRCPFCGSLGTEWHPVERWGRCHAAGCGKQWRMAQPNGGKR